MGIPETAIRRSQTRVSEETPVVCQEKADRRPVSANYDMHYGLELGIVTSGRMLRFYRNAERMVSAGDAWLCGMWEPHGYETHGPGSTVTFVIWPPLLTRLHFPAPPMLDWLQPFRVCPSARPRIPKTKRKAFLDLFTRRLQHMPRSDALWSLHTQLLIIDVLLELMRGWQAPPETAKVPSDMGERLSTAIDAVHSRHAPVPVWEAAQLCGMNRNHFSQAFQNAMGIRFRAFSLCYRLSGVADHLINTSLPIKAIAKEWGFTDQSHLLRHFRQHYGITPAEYRRHPARSRVSVS
jgi:AraC-like DNA-binding protein